MKRKRPPQGALPFVYQAEPDGDAVTAWAGLPLIEEVLSQIRLDKPASELGIRERDRGFSELEMICSAVLLQASGGECLDDLLVLKRDRALAKLLGREFPSPDAMRRFLEGVHDEALFAERPTKPGVAWIAPESDALKKLSEVLRYVVRVMVTHDVLVLMKRLPLADEFRDARPKRLRFRVFTRAAKVLVHARQLVARLAEEVLAAASALLARPRGQALVPLSRCARPPAGAETERAPGRGGRVSPGFRRIRLFSGAPPRTAGSRRARTRDSGTPGPRNTASRPATPPEPRAHSRSGPLSAGLWAGHAWLSRAHKLARVDLLVSEFPESVEFPRSRLRSRS